MWQVYQTRYKYGKMILCPTILRTTFTAIIYGVISRYYLSLKYFALAITSMNICVKLFILNRPARVTLLILKRILHVEKWVCSCKDDNHVSGVENQFDDNYKTTMFDDKYNMNWFPPTHHTYIKFLQELYFEPSTIIEMSKCGLGNPIYLYN